MNKIALASCLILYATAPAAAQYQFNQPRIQTPPPINPYGTDRDSARIYDSKGQYRGNLNSNQFDPNSIANPFGRYGSPYSPDSLNNPYVPRR